MFRWVGRAKVCSKCGGWWVRFAGAAQRASRSRGFNGSKRRDRMTASSTGKPSALTRMRSRGVYSTIPSAMSEATQRGRGRARTSLETSEAPTSISSPRSAPVRRSAGPVGYYDNAPMESFFHALKVEFVHQRQSASQANDRFWRLAPVRCEAEIRPTAGPKQKCLSHARNDVNAPDHPGSKADGQRAAHKRWSGLLSCWKGRSTAEPFHYRSLGVWSPQIDLI